MQKKLDYRLVSCQECKEQYRKLYTSVCQEVFGERFVSNTFYNGNDEYTISDELILQNKVFNKSLEMLVSDIIQSCVTIMFESNKEVDYIKNYRNRKYPSKDKLMYLDFMSNFDNLVDDVILYFFEDALCSVKRGMDICEYMYNEGYIGRDTMINKLFVGNTMTGIEAMVIKIFVGTIQKHEIEVQSCHRYGGMLHNRDLKYAKNANECDFAIIIGEKQKIDIEANKTMEGTVVITGAYDNNDKKKDWKIASFDEDQVKFVINAKVPFIKKGKGEVCLFHIPPLCKCNHEGDKVIHHDLEFFMDINVLDDCHESLVSVYEMRHEKDYNLDDDEDGAYYCDACGVLSEYENAEEYNEYNDNIRKHSYILDGSLHKHMPKVGYRIIFDSDEELFRVLVAWESNRLKQYNIATGPLHHHWYIKQYIDKLVRIIRPGSFTQTDVNRKRYYMKGYYGVKMKEILNNENREIKKHFPYRVEE